MEEATIQRLMTLSQLALDDQAKRELGDNLDAILRFIEIMADVPTDDVEPLAHPLDLNQALRADIALNEIDRERFQAIAPEIDAGFYLVPKVLDQH